MKIPRVRYEEGAAVRFGYGLAWHDFGGLRQQIVVLPIPINIIAGFVRRIYLWACYPWRNCMTKGERACYEIGRRDGFNEGRAE